MIKKFLISILFLVPALFAAADNVQFTMSVASNIISAGEQFRLSFTLNAEGSDLKLPDLSNFDVLMGPSTSQSSSFEMINGKTTSSVSYSYLFILRAKEEGSFTIKPATIKVDGKAYQSNELTIRVVKGQVPQQGSSPATQGQEPSEGSSGTAKDDLFVRTELDRRIAFKGEQIIATVKIYVAPNVNISGFDKVKLPSYEGFWTQDVDMPNQITFTREEYQNRIYQVGVLKKTLLFPQQSGTLKIDPFEITCQVREQIKRQKSFFDDFFDNFHTVAIPLASPTVTVNVKDLPPAPESFFGGVGKMNFSATVDKTEAKANEAVSMKITITGSGNLRLIEAPKVSFPADFEVYDPKTTDNLKATASGLSGTKTFEYLFIPRHEGNYTIPPVKFAHFNPATGQFTTQSSQEFNLKIAKGDESQSTTVTSAYSKQDVRFIGKDIRYIKQNQYKLKNKSVSFFGSPFFLTIYLGSLLIFLLVAFIYRKKLRDNANIQSLRTKKANKVARRRLKEASVYMKKNKAEEFYEAVLKAFWGYLSDKLNIPVADLNREKAMDKLTEKRVDQEVISEFIKLLDTCEFARYSPIMADGTLEGVYHKSAGLMGKLEKQIR